MNDEVDFLHADKYGSFLQIDTMIFDEIVKRFQSSQVFNEFTISQKRS